MEHKPQIVNNSLNTDSTTQNIDKTRSIQQYKIILTNIEGKFTKDFDVVGKMDVFLQFSLGSQRLKTQQASDIGLLPKWKAVIQFTYTTQSEIEIQAFDSDTMTNQYMGSGKILVEALNKKGNYQVILIEKNGNSIGTILFTFENTKPEQLSKDQQQEVKQAKPIQSSTPESLTNNIVSVKEQSKQKIESVKQFQSQNNKSERVISKVSEKGQEIPSDKKSISKNIISTKQINQPQQQKSERKISQKSSKKEEPIYNNITNVTFDNNEGNYQSNNPYNPKHDDLNHSINQDSINRSQNTFKLPNIGDISRNFGDKIFDKQSSATLQKSILVFSMPKAPRFGNGPKYSGEPSYYIDSCFKPNSTKGVGFGFGSKRQFPEWMEKNMKQNPAPGSYFDAVSRRSEFRARGPTFGISHKYYEKVTIPKESSQQKNVVHRSNDRLKPIVRNS